MIWPDAGIDNILLNEIQRVDLGSRRCFHDELASGPKTDPRYKGKARSIVLVDLAFEIVQILHLEKRFPRLQPDRRGQAALTVPGLHGDAADDAGMFGDPGIVLLRFELHDDEASILAVQVYNEDGRPFKHGLHVIQRDGAIRVRALKKRGIVQVTQARDVLVLGDSKFHGLLEQPRFCCHLGQLFIGYLGNRQLHDDESKPGTFLRDLLDRKSVG
jgi:hypothetical protein